MFRDILDLFDLLSFVLPVPATLRSTDYFDRLGCERLSSDPRPSRNRPGPIGCLGFSARFSRRVSHRSCTTAQYPEGGGTGM
jgi:hypothetical protein